MRALLTPSLLALLLGALIPCPADPPAPVTSSPAPAAEPPRDTQLRWVPGTHPSAWALDVLRKESDYIVNCSFTEDARNHNSVRPAAAYGAINVDRIFQKGADWVRPGEAAMGAIGLMSAAIQLKADGNDITRYDRVLGRFFRTWVLTRKQPVNNNPSRTGCGGFFERVYYNTGGQWKGHDEVNAGVTGQMLAAMWKFYEYNAAVGQTQTADDWLRQAWPIARHAGDFLRKNYNARYHLVRANSGRSDLWISDSAYAVMALKCLDRWAGKIERGGERTPPRSVSAHGAAARGRTFDYGALADQIAAGLRQLKDHSARSNFFRYRDSSHQYQPTYGDRIDQLCFLPYEADVIEPGEPFTRSLSDWWTNGSDGISLTFQTPDHSDWRNFGTRYRYLLASGKGPEAEEDKLYPGPGLQLAKVEWKYARRTGDPVALERARKRLEWVRSAAYSNLWLGCNGTTEANVPNGLVDWRDAANYDHKADDWARFVDTSAYFIEVTLMLEYGVDTKYVPN